jgi:acyl-CoA synthetase (AMP-forming)/AMP-acid ligase II
MAMPSQMMEELARVFCVPVRPSYGSSETGIMTATPMPPRAQKLGSVGIAIDTNVSIWGPDGKPVPPLEVGDGMLSGPRVTSGYEGNAELTAAAFVNGWYKTGDLGYLDEDGYLFVVGRVKEVINRGGQKVSPEYTHLRRDPTVLGGAVLPQMVMRIDHHMGLLMGYLPMQTTSFKVR